MVKHALLSNSALRSKTGTLFISIFGCGKFYGWYLHRSYRVEIVRHGTHLSNKRDVKLTDFGKFHPAQNKSPPCMFIDFITKVSDVIAEPNEDFSHGHFEL